MNLSLKKFGLVLALFCLLTSIFLMCAVPPVSRDALTHHLAVPKLYLQHGGILELPDIIFSYYPQLLDLIYCIPMMFDNDIAPKYIHFSFALLTALLIFYHLKQKTGWFLSALSAMFFLSLPIIVKLSVTVYVDLGLIFFSTASLLSLIKWHEKKFKIHWLLISAIFCGLALGTKYNGLVTCFILTLFVPVIYLREESQKNLNIKAKQFKAAGYAIGFFVISTIIFSPWMAKNYIWTKNPVYPLYDNFFNPKHQPALEDENSEPSVSHFLLRKHIHKESWIETAAIPIRIFFQGEDDNPKFFDGRLNPLLFFLPLFAFMRTKKGISGTNTHKKIMLAFSVLYILIVFFQQDMRIRWIGPAIPPLVILSAYGFKNILQSLDQMTTQLSKNSSMLLKYGKHIFCTVIFIISSLNAVYIYDLFKKTSPIEYIIGQISRPEYIKKFRPEYAALKFANKKLPSNTKILAFFLGNRRYYSDHDIAFNYSVFKKLVYKSETSEDLFNGLKKQAITDLIINYSKLNSWINDSFNDEEKIKIKAFFNGHTKKLFSGEGHGLYQLKSS